MAKRVIIALMDGVRPDAITQIRHPFFEKLTQEGSFCMTGRTVAPPRAFPAHISLFTSVDPGQHGIVTNDIRPFPSEFAGLMQILQEAGKQTAAVVIWEQLCSVGRSEDMTVPMFCTGSLFPAGRAAENWSLLDIAPTVCKCLDVEIPGQFAGKSLI